MGLATTFKILKEAIWGKTICPFTITVQKTVNFLNKDGTNKYSNTYQMTYICRENTKTKKRSVELIVAKDSNLGIEEHPVYHSHIIPWLNGADDIYGRGVTHIDRKAPAQYQEREGTNVVDLYPKPEQP